MLIRLLASSQPVPLPQLAQRVRGELFLKHGPEEEAAGLDLRQPVPSREIVDMSERDGEKLFAERSRYEAIVTLLKSMACRGPRTDSPPRLASCPLRWTT